MKRSAYTEFLEDDRHLYAINLVSLGILTFPKGTCDQVERILDDPATLEACSGGAQLAELLTENGFLLEKEEDEIKTLQRRHDLSRGSPRVFAAQIAITLDCNFRCSYCYESRKPVSLSRERQDAVVALLRRGMEDWNVLNIIWFGGEPLLEIGAIRRMSEAILAESRICGTTFKGYVVTNGYLLDVRTARHLAESGVAVAQVTLDGDASTHDTRRVLPGGCPTYARILENIHSTCDQFDVTIVRINIEDQPVDALLGVIEALDEVKGQIALRFSQTNDVGKCIRQRGSHSKFLMKVSDLTERSLAMGFRISTEAKLPGGSFCPAYATNCLLVDARGDIHRCVADTGNAERRVGFVTADGEIQPERGGACYDFDPFSDSDCLACRALPLCMGGCPKFPVTGKSGSGRCVVKENLRTTLVQMVREHGGTHGPVIRLPQWQADPRQLRANARVPLTGSKEMGRELTATRDLVFEPDHDDLGSS